MECNHVKKIISLYIDGQLSEKEAMKVKEHLDRCQQCKTEYEQMLNIIRACKTLEDISVPEGYGEIIKENIYRQQEKPWYKRRWIRIIASAAAVLMVFISIAVLFEHNALNKAEYQTRAERTAQSISGTNDTYDVQATAQSKVKTSSDQSNFGGISSEEQSSISNSGGIASDAELQQSLEAGEQRKIIKSAYITMETEQFDKAVDSTIGRAVALGGYVSNSDYTNEGDNKRSAHIEIKVPQNVFDQYLDGMDQYGRITHDKRTGQDVTAEYIDTETRVKMLKIKEEKLMTLLSQAKTLQDMFTVQDQLTDTQIEIERLTSNLQRWDSMVNFSTIVTDIYEVEKLEPKPIENPSIGQRMSQTFMASIKAVGKFGENLVVFMAGAIPYLVPLGLVAWMVWMFIKRRKIL